MARRAYECQRQILRIAPNRTNSSLLLNSPSKRLSPRAWWERDESCHTPWHRHSDLALPRQLGRSLSVKLATSLRRSSTSISINQCFSVKSAEWNLHHLLYQRYLKAHPSPLFSKMSRILYHTSRIGLLFWYYRAGRLGNSHLGIYRFSKLKGPGSPSWRGRALEAVRLDGLKIASWTFTRSSPCTVTAELQRGHLHVAAL